MPDSAPQQPEAAPSTPLKRFSDWITRALAALCPPGIEPIWVWAEKHYNVIVSQRSGPFRIANAPWTKAIYERMKERRIRKIVLRCSAQSGKALACDTPIPTPGGWTAMGDLNVGDVVFDESGKQCRVVFATEVMHDRACYIVRFSDGSEIVADAEHKWTVDDTGFYGSKPDQVTITTQQMVDGGYRKGKRNRFAIPVCGPVICTKSELPVDPYLLGLWLGDGHSYSTGISVGNQDIDEITANIERLGYYCETIPDSGGNWFLKVDPVRGQHGHLCFNLGKQLRSMGLMRGQHSTDRDNRKHIPKEYLRASICDRFALLQGLMDSDGSCDLKKRSCEFSSTSKAIADGFAELISSLGFKAVMGEREPSCSYKGVKVFGNTSYRFSFIAYDNTPVFRLKRKLCRQPNKEGRRTSETLRRRIVSITPTPSVPVRCIQVNSPSNLYLAGKAFIPTHNTELLLVTMTWTVAEDPGPGMLVMASKDDVEEFWLERLLPTLRGCKPTADRIPKDDRSLAKICAIHFPGGTLEGVGAKARSKLQSRPRRYLWLDEVRNWAPWALPMVLKRARTYSKNSLTIVASTPDLVGDTMDTEFLSGTQEHFHVQCPQCGKRLTYLRFRRVKKGEELQPGVFATADGGMHYDTNDITCPGGKWDFPEMAKTIRYVWPCCGAVSLDNGGERQRIAESAVATVYNPKAPADTASFTWSAILPPWNPWSDAVQEYLLAMVALKAGNPEPLKTFITETLGEPWKNEYRDTNRGEALQYAKAKYDVREKWPEEIRRFMTVDVQAGGGRHYYWLIRAFGLGGTSRLIAWGRAHSTQELQRIADEWGVAGPNWGYDTGHAAVEIYKLLLSSGRSELTGTLWKGFKGDKAENYKVDGITQPWRLSEWIDPYQGTPEQGTSGFLRVILFSKSHMLDRLAFCLRQIGPAFLIPDQTPEGMPDLAEYIGHVTAYQQMDEVDSRGVTTSRWHKVREMEHWNSCEMMALVAAMATGVFAAPPPPPPPTVPRRHDQDQENQDEES